MNTFQSGSKKLFEVTEPQQFEAMILAKPSSAYMRRIWFLFEWLLEVELNIPDAKTGTYADIVDAKLQYAIKGSTVRRHRIRNNLLGTRDFCPLVRRTEALELLVAAQLDARVKEVVGTISAGVLARTAAFLLLKDSKSSYAIEDEAPPQDRIQRLERLASNLWMKMNFFGFNVS